MDDKKIKKLSPEEAIKKLDKDELARYNRFQAEEVHNEGVKNTKKLMSEHSKMAQKIIDAGKEERMLKGTIILDDKSFECIIDMKKAEDTRDEINEMYNKNDKKEISEEEKDEILEKTVDIMEKIIVNDWSYKEFWEDFINQNGVYTFQRFFIQIGKIINEDMESIRKFRRE